MKRSIGKLIVIEGTDGSGKATQSKMLVDYLKNHRFKYSYFDFPQYQKSFFGRFIGKFLRGELGDPGSLNPYLISLPFAADRWQAKPKIQQALQQKHLVICNRYVSSNIAYHVSRAPLKLRYNLFRWLNSLEYKQYGVPKEDLVLFLYVPSSVSMELIKQKKTRQYLKGKRDVFESDRKFLQQVEKTYLWLLKKNTHWLKIDCVEKNKLLSKTAIHKKIIRVLQEHKYL